VATKSTQKTRPRVVSDDTIAPLTARKANVTAFVRATETGVGVALGAATRSRAAQPSTASKAIETATVTARR
jgi:hypothetical protein